MEEALQISITYLSLELLRHFLSLLQSLFAGSLSEQEGLSEGGKQPLVSLTPIWHANTTLQNAAHCLRERAARVARFFGGGKYLFNGMLNSCHKGTRGLRGDNRATIIATKSPLL